MSNPMEQFSVKPIIPLKIGNIDVSFTNSALFMVITVVVSTLIFAFCLRKRTIVPSVSQSIPETIYEFISSLIKENVGVEGLKYFSFKLIKIVFIYPTFTFLISTSQISETLLSKSFSLSICYLPPN